MITKVTITGADDSISAAQLAELSKEFPFVEWGILFSPKQQGNNRFPSLDWLDSLVEVKQANPSMNLSAHLCGRYVRQLLIGQVEFIHEMWNYWPMFGRVQINTHGEPHEWNSVHVANFLNIHHQKEFIFQYDNVNTDLLEAIAKAEVKNISALYDLSHGAGVLPESWPKPLDYCDSGYAGGLSPDNWIDQLTKIQSIVGDRKTWVDIETHVRSEMDSKFDLEKVKRVLQQSIQFIPKNVVV